MVEAAARHGAEAGLLTEAIARNAQTHGDIRAWRTGQLLAVRIATPSFNGVLWKSVV
jgi:hypothetical protein